MSDFLSEAGPPPIPTRKGSQPPPIPMKAKKPTGEVAQALAQAKGMRSADALRAKLRAQGGKEVGQSHLPGVTPTSEKPAKWRKRLNQHAPLPFGDLVSECRRVLM